jgi:hypothetical protein
MLSNWYNAVSGIFKDALHKLLAGNAYNALPLHMCIDPAIAGNQIVRFQISQWLRV